MTVPAGFTQFAVRLFILSLICAGGAYLCMSAGLLQLPPVFAYLPVLLFFTLSTIMQFFLLRAVKGRPQLFVTMFMGLQALKMFIHLVVLVAVAFGNRPIAIHFILMYAVYYLVYTVAEVLGLMARNKPAGKVAG